MANVLGYKIPSLPNCCCGHCHIRTGCTMIAASGVSADRAFFGLCCSCLPKRACVSLWIQPEDDICGCAPEGNDGLTPIWQAQAEWDCQTNSYNGELRCADPSVDPIDFQIGYEQDIPVDTLGGGFRSGNCFLVLRSAALGYTWPNREGTDNRIWIEAGYDNAARKEGCGMLGYEFDIDLSPLYGMCGEAQIKIVPSDHEKRDPVVSGFWDGADVCFYKRICVTYESYGDPPVTVYACRGTIYGEDGYLAEFENIEGEADFPIRIIVDSQDPEMVLSLETNVETLAGKQVTCPYAIASWTLGSGATVTVRGDQRADCTDCKCWCRCLCVQLNHSDRGVFRAELCWDEYENGWFGNLSNPDPDSEEADIPIGITLVCDECDGVTDMRIEARGREHFVQVDCDELVAEVFYQDNDDYDANINITVVCKKCTTCFSPFLISVDCCPDDPLPNSLSLTIEPDDADFDPGPPPLPGAGSCTGANDVVTLTFQGAQIGGGFINEWWGSAAIFSGCDTIVSFRLRCKNISGDLYQWELSVSTATAGPTDYLSSFAVCDPLELVFSKIQIGASNECCEPLEVVDTINNYKATVTL